VIRNGAALISAEHQYVVFGWLEQGTYIASPMVGAMAPLDSYISSSQIVAHDGDMKGPRLAKL